MNIVKTYGNYIKKKYRRHPPRQVPTKTITSDYFQQFRTRTFCRKKDCRKAYQQLNMLGVKNRVFTRWTTFNGPGVIRSHLLEIFHWFGLSRALHEMLLRLSQEFFFFFYITAQKAVEIASTSCSFLSQRFYRCRTVSQLFHLLKTWCDTPPWVWVQYWGEFVKIETGIAGLLTRSMNFFLMVRRRWNTMHSCAL